MSARLTQGEAANKCARDTFDRVASSSPLFAGAVTGVARDVVINLMAQCFLAGVIDGAERIAGEPLAVKTQPRASAS